MEFGGRKRGRQDGGWNGAPKRPRDEMESFTPGVGSKSKPCTKFFSTSGCPFAEGCHFLHYVPGGAGPTPSPSPSPTMGRKPGPPFGDTPIKSKLCNKMNTPEGCKFGEKCRFAHSQMEVNNNNINRQGGAQGFGESATAKISIDGSLAGPIIGKGGVNSKQICRVTGVKLAIRDHESDGSQKNIELEGSFDQIKHASAMVHDLILNIAAAAPPTTRGGGGGGGGGFQQGYGGGGANKIKTKMCENFVKGQCTFGERCHFAHGQNELRR